MENSKNPQNFLNINLRPFDTKKIGQISEKFENLSKVVAVRLCPHWRQPDRQKRQTFVKGKYLTHVR